MKKILFYLTLIIFSLSFYGCSSKKNETAETYSEKVADTVFQQILYRKFFKSSLKNPENFYLPEDFYNFLVTPVYTKNGRIYVFEKLNPSFTGILDSLYIYDSASDNGKWTETAVDSGEVERLSLELEQLIEESDGKYGLLSQKEKELQQEAEEVRFLNEDLRLKIMKYGEEYFLPQKSGENLVFINTDKDCQSRDVYDKDFRLIKSEKWIISPESTKRVSLESYEYAPDTVFVVSKKTVKDGFEEDFYYTMIEEKSYLTRYEKFETGKNGKRKFLQSENWTFDKTGQLISEIQGETKDGKLFEKKTCYTYNKNHKNPDSEYFENGTLKIKTHYSSDSDYETVIYFDEEFSVHTFYEKNRKVRDVYYAGENILREQLYE